MNKKFPCHLPSSKEDAIAVASQVIDHLIVKKKTRFPEKREWAIDKICMMTTRLACNQAIESSYWRMDNDSDVGLLTGYVLCQLPVELEFMDLDTFPC
jgi:hypothetical protein